MKFLLIIFFIYLIYVIVRPMIKVWRTVHKVKKGDFSAFADLFGQPGSQKSKTAYEPDGTRKAGWTKARFRKKKIDPTVGEYVKFSEVTLTEEELSSRNKTTGQTTSFVTEQQVTDIEWEDIR